MLKIPILLSALEILSVGSTATPFDTMHIIGFDGLDLSIGFQSSPFPGSLNVEGGFGTVEYSLHLFERES